MNLWGGGPVGGKGWVRGLIGKVFKITLTHLRPAQRQAVLGFFMHCAVSGPR